MCPLVQVPRHVYHHDLSTVTTLPLRHSAERDSVALPGAPRALQAPGVGHARTQIGHERWQNNALKSVTMPNV